VRFSTARWTEKRGPNSEGLRCAVEIVGDESLSAGGILVEARRIALPRAMYRVEVAVIMLVAAVFVGLSLLEIVGTAASWWIWPPIGIAACALIVWLSLRDNAFMLPIIAAVCYERLDYRKLRLLDVRDDVSEGLHYHKLLFDEIAHQRTPLLGPIVFEVDHLLIAMYRIAQSIDQFVADDRVRDYLQSLAPKAGGAHASTLHEYTISVLGDDNTGAVANDTETERVLLKRVYANLMQARGELQNAIKKLVVAHGKVAGITRAENDFEFVPDVRAQLAQHSQQLETRRQTIDALRRFCEMEAAVQAA
jgi:hypothetical protein